MRFVDKRITMNDLANETKRYRMDIDIYEISVPFNTMIRLLCEAEGKAISIAYVSSKNEWTEAEYIDVLEKLMNNKDSLSIQALDGNNDYLVAFCDTTTELYRKANDLMRLNESLDAKHREMVNNLLDIKEEQDKWYNELYRLFWPKKLRKKFRPF